MLRIALLAFFAVTFTAFTARATEQMVSVSTPLTADQVRKFFNSYPAIHAMAGQYWGERRFTPKNKMLAPPKTFDRALQEMKAAHALPEFENLLQSNGFADVTTWMSLAKRISYAYVMLRMPVKYPVDAERRRHFREQRAKFLAEERAKLSELPERQRASRTGMLNDIEQTLRTEALAERDAEVLRPSASYFEQMDKFMFEGMR
jgi:hypothetical protein